MRVWSLTAGAVSVAVLLRADVGPVVVGLVQIIVFLLEELKQRLRLLLPESPVTTQTEMHDVRTFVGCTKEPMFYTDRHP